MFNNSKRQRTMKKNIFYTLAAVVTFLTFSCSKDTEVQTPDKPVPVDPIVPTEKSVVLSGAVDATKVSSDNNGAYKWQASDIITILTDNGNNREFTAEEAGISTDFSGHIPDADELEGGFALYPASENHSISGTTITFNIPNELAWGADASYMPMYAPITIVEQKPSASFKAVGGALKLILYNIPSGAAYLAFTAASVNIAGDFSLDTTAETPVISGGESKEIDINFSDNYSANKVFYIPLPPVTLTGGFTISIFDDEANELFSVTSTKGITIGRNKLVIAPALNCGAPPTADDQLTNSDITGSGLGGSYADVVITSATGKTWNVNALKSSSRIQLKKDVTTSYIQLPAYDDNIASVVLNGVYNGSGSAYTGTIKIVTALNDGEELASVTPSISAGDNVSLSLPDGNKSGYIISNDAALQITSITVKFRGIDYPTISADSEELTIPVGDLSVSTDVTLSYPVDGLGVSALLGNNADWIDTAVIENGELTVTAKATNTTDTDRVATVTLKASGASNKDISVTQKSCVVPNPTDLAAIAGEEIATITWTKEAHATSYLAFLHTATTATPANGGTDVSNSAQLSDGVYTIALDGLTNNQTYYLYVKVNEVVDNYQSPTGYEHVEFTPVADVWDLKSIEVTTPPTNTEYEAGEFFDPTGMVVTATFENHDNTEQTKEETVDNASLTFTPSTSTALTTEDTSVEISYTVDAITKSTTQTITVTAVPNEYYELISTVGDLETGEYVIAGMTESAYYAMPAISAGKINGTEVTVSPKNRIDAATGDSYAITITKNNSGEVAIGSGTTYLEIKTSGTDFGVTTTANYYSVSVTDGAFGISNTRHLVWRNTSNVFGNYANIFTSEYCGVYLFKKVDNTVWNLKSIAVTTPPTKTSYEAGETFDPTGMVVTATYQDQAGVKADKTEPIANGDLTFSPDLETALTTDDESVSISYGGQSTTQSITVTAPVTWDLKSIAVTTAPTKTTYTEGDTFDPAGMVVTAHYEDHNDNTNTKDEIVSNGDLTFSPSTSTALTTSDVSVTITYNGKSTTQLITVNAASATVYYEKVTSTPLSWSGEYLLVCENQNVSLSSISTTSTKYGIGASVTISNNKIESNATTDAYKIVIAGATGNGSGYTIKFGASYLYWGSGNSLATNASESDNSRWTITAGATTGNWVITNVAQNTRKIWYNTGSPRFACYENKTEKDSGYAPVQLYKLEDNTVWDLKSIAVTTPPTKTTYVAGENFDPTGMVVTATYEDQAGVKADKTEPIANGDLTFSPSTSTALTTDNTAITITYEGQSTSQAITVNAVYAITIDNATVNGTVDADKSSAIAGATINLTASPSSGYVLDEWNVYKTGDSSTKVTVTSNSFTMPAYAVTVSATFVQSPTITMNTTSITDVAAAGGNFTATSAYTLENGASNDDVEITYDGCVTVASKAATAGNISYTVAENTGAAREGHIYVKYSTEDAHTITVSQLAGAADISGPWATWGSTSAFSVSSNTVASKVSSDYCGTSATLKAYNSSDTQQTVTAGNSSSFYFVYFNAAKDSYWQIDLPVEDDIPVGTTINLSYYHAVNSKGITSWTIYCNGNSLGTATITTNGSPTALSGMTNVTKSYTTTAIISSGSTISFKIVATGSGSAKNNRLTHIEVSAN